LCHPFHNHSRLIPGCFIINGDRHWQYHSVNPVTGLNELGCDPASDAHAQGWNPKDKRPKQRFLRVKGGFASITIAGKKPPTRPRSSPLGTESKR
jgi:hypothetical protein